MKSLQSAAYKYDRYYPNRPAAKVFDDLLGFRSLCDSYDPVLSATAVPRLRIVDMSSGKAKDDGYRGVHVYFQMDNFYYPIEIQYTSSDNVILLSEMPSRDSVIYQALYQ